MDPLYMDLNGYYRSEESSSSDEDSCDSYGYAKKKRKNNKDTEAIKKKNTVYNMQYDRYKVFESQDMEKGQFDLVLEIEEKKLYVHKFYLITASETLGAMLSDRWNTTPNEAIKIENYSYDDFYEFMCFIYCGTCALTNENIMALTDMAEFYGVPLLKDYCDTFLCKTNNYVNIKNIEKMVELAERYSLTKFTVALQRCIRQKVSSFVYDKNFINFEKSFVKFLAGVERYENVESEFFEAVFKWAENQALIKKKMSEDENFNLQDAIKEELIDFLPKIKFNAMSVVFIANNIIRDKPYLFSTFECYKILMGSKRYDRDNVLFKAVYELAEKELNEKQKVSASDNFNFEDAIKCELAEILPCIDFNNMPLDFIISFILPDKTFLFSTSQLYGMLITSRRYLQEEAFFKAIYGLAEKEALEKQKGSSDDDFDVESAIKSALVDILHSVKFEDMNLDFVIKFIIDKQFLFDYPQMYFILCNCRKQGSKNEEKLFQALYELAEAEVLEKQKLSMETEDVFNVAEEIKNRLTEYIPFVDFYKMSQAFLVDFVAAKGFTSVEQALHAHYICVEIKNGDNTLTGTFKDDFKLYDQVRGYEYGRTKITHHSEVKQRFFKLKFKIPSIPSTVTKMKGVEWYLCLEQDGVVTVKNHNFLANTDYLICELYAKDDFRLLGKSTMISASRHKIF